MPNDLVTQLQNLRNLTNTNRSNRAVNNRENSEVAEPLVSNNQDVDWQLVASYLDSEMFSFILRNRDNQTIKDFGIQLSSNLANKFGLTR
jgi:hypothetical protein|tara:strand:- start:180 stop:449 length:270 start_codon:yes stop_codon:yes gene_type:complete